ncbi:metallophosphoesterase [Sphingobacteriales bacterium UPWRP_1]|nr:hypothetical protein B6N25_07780 [Sphingobacteriales bacterium TSM_CSS]PSJ75520.1 metallophosphoesterase [Sphingobacteriales bacterium UPWRP_1]
MPAPLRWIAPFLFLLFFDVYAFQLVKTVTASLWVTGVYWLLAAFTYVVVFAGVVLGIRLHNNARRMYITAVVFMLFIFKFLLSIFTLADDLVRLLKLAYLWLGSGSSAALPERSAVICMTGLIVSGVPFLAMLHGMARNAYRYKVRNVALPVQNLPDELTGLRIVQISDIHTGSFITDKPIQRAVALINNQQPDLVFFTGDLVNNRASEAAPYLHIFSKIKARYGVFSVLGNHDYGDYVQWPSEQQYRGNFEEMRNNHSALGWNLLLNEHRIINHKGHKIAIIGVENWSASPRFKRYGNLQQAYQNIPSDCAVQLLLSHDPSHWKAEVLPQFPNINATFSGHTHAFQFAIRLFGFKWSPVQLMYKEWVGLYRQQQQCLYVNPGFGFVGYPGRVGYLPEITVFELHRSKV